MWNSRTTYMMYPPHARSPKPIHGGISEHGHPVWLQVGPQRLAVHITIEHWHICDDHDGSVVRGYAWLLELTDGSRYLVIRDPAADPAWQGEPWTDELTEGAQIRYGWALRDLANGDVHGHVSYSERVKP